MVDALLYRSSLRFFIRHPAQLVLSVLGIVLGVAIVTAVVITNASSSVAFTLSANAVTGKSTHQIVGAEFGVAQAFYASLRREAHYPMAPVIEGYVSIGGELLTLLGIDPFASAGLQMSDMKLIEGSLAPLVLSERAVLISQRTHDRLGFESLADKPGAKSVLLSADMNGVSTEIEIAGVYQSQNPAATDGLLVTDIAIAQSLLDRGQFIDRIDLVLTPAQARYLVAKLPRSLRLVSASKRSQTMADMTRGFQINLTAMSLLALLVGAFLIHNTMTFSILQRRELFATLRIVGVTSGGIFRSILSETFAISLVGSVLGLIAGFGIAHYLIRLTTQTINDLYFVLHVQQVLFSPVLGAGIVCLGVLTSMLAAAASALEASTISPVQARMRSRLEARTHSVLPLLALAGLCLMITGALLAVLPTQSLILGFVALMALIVGYGLGIPWIIAKTSMLLRDPAALLRRKASPASILMAFSVGGIQRSISRTGVAIAALAIAVAATFGVDIMIGSFRSTVDQWLGKTLQSDIYISAPDSASSGSGDQLEAQLIQRIGELDSVLDWSSAKTSRVITSAGDINMLVLEPHSDSAAGFDFLDGNPQAIWQTFMGSKSVLVSEPLATKHRLQAGQMLSIFTAEEGDSEFMIAGVYHDYGSSHGRITIARSTHDRFWRDTSISSVGLNLKANADSATTLENVRQLLQQSQQQLLVRSNQEIRARSLEVFDRTFQVTRVLRLLTIGVAFVGIFSALLALQMERAREFAILRASGATAAQVAGVILLQTALMGGFAGLLALPLGWMMSEVLINVINLRSFGWSMQSLLPAGSVSATLLLAFSSAWLAGLYPAWRLGTANIAAQLRDE